MADPKITFDKNVIEFEGNCCSKPMVVLKKIPSALSNGVSTMWICSKCGGYYQFTGDQLDEEALQSYKENYPDEFKEEV